MTVVVVFKSSFLSLQQATPLLLDIARGADVKCRDIQSLHVPSLRLQQLLCMNTLMMELCRHALGTGTYASLIHGLPSKLSFSFSQASPLGQK